MAKIVGFNLVAHQDLVFEERRHPHRFSIAKCIGPPIQGLCKRSLLTLVHRSFRASIGVNGFTDQTRRWMYSSRIHLGVEADHGSVDEAPIGPSGIDFQAGSPALASPPKRQSVVG